MFDGLTPEAKALLDAAASDLPTARADAGLLHAMAEAVSVGVAAPTPLSRRRPMLRKVLTAKAAAIAGVLVLTGGVASAATGSLPDLAQDAAHDAAETIGLNIPAPDSDDSLNADADDEAKTDADTDTDADEPKADDDGVKADHPDNHGKDVSTVARDRSTQGRDHGTAVCTVASDGKCKAGETKPTTTTVAEDSSEPQQGKSAEHRRDGEHRNDKSKPTPTTAPSTTTTTTAP